MCDMAILQPFIIWRSTLLIYCHFQMTCQRTMRKLPVLRKGNGCNMKFAIILSDLTVLKAEEAELRETFCTEEGNEILVVRRKRKLHFGN